MRRENPSRSNLDLRSLEKVFSVSIDVDGIRFYHRIHGLPEPNRHTRDPIWEEGIPRFLDLLEDLSIPATFFLVGSDLVPRSRGGEAPEPETVSRRQKLLRRISAEGHSIASHSFSHDYALSRKSYREALQDLNRASLVLRHSEDDRTHRGFRAPGYLVSENLCRAACDAGSLYSSSRLPSLPYASAKALVLAYGKLRGRSSHAILGDLGSSFTPHKPYRHRCGLLELPISVLPPFFLPAIGTLFTLLKNQSSRWFATRLLSRRWLHIEFHGIDFLDSFDPGVSPLLSRHQRDLPFPATKKLERYHSILSAIAEARTPMRLEEIALQIQK